MKKLSLAFKLSNGSTVVAELNQSPFVMGSLPSSQLVLNFDGVEPIHALLEWEDGGWELTTLGADSETLLNGQRVDVSALVKEGDQIGLGRCQLTVQPEVVAAPPAEPLAPVPPPPKGRFGRVAKHLATPPEVASLFEGQDSVGSGSVLEVVAYWHGSVLEVEHFHPRRVGFSRVTIGDLPGAHLPAAVEDRSGRHVLALPGESGYEVHLLRGMKASLRQDGVRKKLEQEGKVSLGPRDICQIEDGPIRYFMLMMNPLRVTLPPVKAGDVVLQRLSLASFSVYALLILVLSATKPEKKKPLDDEVWSVVHAREKVFEIQKQQVLPAPVPAPTAPPPPVPQPVTAEEPEKPPVSPKPPEAQLTREALAVKEEVSPVSADRKEKEQSAPAKATRPLGSPGMGNGSKGAVRQGSDRQSLAGVQGGAKGKSSGFNLSKIGLGVGKVSSATGPGAVYSKFKSSAGGAGGGSGSGSRTLGLGGTGTGVASVGLAGAGDALSQFGSGKEGFTDGNAAAAALGRRQGSRAVKVQPGDPLVSGGLTQEEILAVIRQHLAQVRHCYERLLQARPQASGRIKVQFVVGQSGSVQSVQITESSLPDGSLADCVTGLIQRWRFPKPRDGVNVTVNYPFTFNPI